MAGEPSPAQAANARHAKQNSAEGQARTKAFSELREQLRARGLTGPALDRAVAAVGPGGRTEGDIEAALSPA